MFLFGRKFLFLVIISQLVAPKDASANTTADQIFASNSDNSTPITAVVEKPDTLTLPTLSPNPKSKIQNSKLPQVETITTENLVFNLDTTLSINGADLMSSFPGKLYVYDKLVDNDDYSISSWNNQGGNVKDWLVTGNGDTVLCGSNSAGFPAFKKTTDANWTTIHTSFPVGEGANDIVGIPNGPSTTNINWFIKGYNKIFKKVGTTGALQEVLNLTGLNSITSNGTDTIYVAYGSQGKVRAYNINNFSQYTDIKYNLPSIQMTSLSWKNGHLLATTGNGKSFILKNGETSWTQVSDEGTGNGFATSAWLQGSGASEFDFAVGSYTQNKVNFYREVLAPSFTSATLSKDTLLVNPGSASDSTDLTVVISNEPDEVHADFSALGGSDSVALTNTGNDTWTVEDQNFTNATPGTYLVAIIGSNLKGSVSTTVPITVIENSAPVWTNPVDTIFVNEGSPTSYTINSSDPNGHSVTTSYTNTPTFLTPNGATISGTPGNSNVGVHSVSGRLVDSFQDTTNTNFNVKVVNKAPEFTSNPPLFGNVGTPYSYTPSLQYHNPNNPVQAVTLPPWASFNNGTLSGNPTFGTFAVVLRSNDGNGGVTDQTFEIVVNDANPFADSLRNNTNHLVSSPDSVFTVNLPKKYNDPNQTFQAFNIGTAVQSINFENSSDTLKVHVVLKPGNQRTFRIRVLNGAQNQFESGFLTLNLEQNILVMISQIQTFYSYVGDTVVTRISAGGSTKWELINVTDNNRLISTETISTTGIIEKKHIVLNSWLNNTDSIQHIKIQITNLISNTGLSRIIPIKKILTSTAEEEKQIPSVYILQQNYPNPFNPSTRIAFGLPESGEVSLKVYDLLGKTVAVLVEGFREAGTYSVQFDARNLSGGVYFYELNAGSFRDVKKLTLLK